LDKCIRFEDGFPDEVIRISLPNLYLTDRRIIFPLQEEVGKGNLTELNHPIEIKNYLSYEDLLFVDFKYRYRNGLLILSCLVGLLALLTNPETVFMIIALITSLCGLLFWRMFRVPYLNILTNNHVDTGVLTIQLPNMDNGAINGLINTITELIPDR